MFGWNKVSGDNASKILDFMKEHMKVEDKIIDRVVYSVDLEDHPQKGLFPSYGQIKVKWYQYGVLFSLKKWEDRTHKSRELILYTGILKVL